ncbi:hypothetical protein J5N97_006361 [Dioscorea zingiberensis]|uniref:ABC transporter domain-containing protein n=1 Tax=Dioscorea zingiberensis TaxID=325984 RepID=A0A9D5HSP7_9LILI|nr:hypothetical protein J5N97_006361 [Dioscorea zingiberensis]
MDCLPKNKMHHDTVEDGVIYLGAMFIGLVTHLFNGFAELAMSVASSLYSTNRETSALSIMGLWIANMDSQNTNILSLMCGLDSPHLLCHRLHPNIERFFRHYLLLVLVESDGVGLFPLLAAVGRRWLLQIHLAPLHSLCLGSWWLPHITRPGVLTALMGVSGAGKTTLMDVLAGRKTGGYIDGDINISVTPKKQETFARVSGYCEQSDIHSPHVTPMSLFYSLHGFAYLLEVGEKARKMFIEEVMDLVELTSLRGALVGLPGVNGLSTEQRKRLTIAVELVANPSIIFMDEPTSGLDARAAAIVMRTVRNTVDTGRTAVCTNLHQPSIDILQAFDELFLMKRGGEEIYVGPLGRNWPHLIKYFEGINGKKFSGVNFAELYKNSDLYRRNKALISELSAPPQVPRTFTSLPKFSQSFFTQCMENEQDLFNSLGSIYAAALFIGVQNGQTVQPIVDVERTVFYREKAAECIPLYHMHSSIRNRQVLCKAEANFPSGTSHEMSKYERIVELLTTLFPVWVEQ